MNRALGLVAIAVFLSLGCHSHPEQDDADISDDGGCGTIGQSCDTSPECPADQVCVDHACDCALDREYEVMVMSGLVYNRAPGGNCWDDDPPSCADLPEVSFEIQIGDNEPYRTPICESPTENEPYLLVAWDDATFHAQIEEHAVPQVWIFDDDGDTEQLMGEYSLEALDHIPWLTIENLRQGGLTLFVPTDGPLSHEVNLIFSPR